MFIYVPEPNPREGIAPTLELQIRARLDNASTEHVGEAVTISSPQYETFIAQCTEALQLPVLEAHVETLTWSADGHTLTPTIHTTTGTAIPAWTPAVLEQTEAYPGGTIRYVDTTYGPIPCTPQGTVIIDAAIATSIHHARV